MRIKLFLCLFLLLLLNLAFAQETLIHHELSVTVLPTDYSVEVKDVVTIPANQLQRDIHFLLNENLLLTANTKIEISSAQPTAADFGVQPENLNLPKRFACKHYILELPGEQTTNFSLTLTYKGKIHYPVKEMAEEYARSFSETPGIIDSAGVFLGGLSYWIPWFNDRLVTFNMTVSLPENWDAVSQGKRTLHQVNNHKRVTRWESPEPMEEVYLIAARFNEYERSVGAVKAMAFLRTADENLANKYLQTTAQYLEMYRQLIGPYPFTKFALVENFWETGYGMPSFTLLGQQIIRFPFILHSSYPHELLHNWWGNSVFVDYDQGNWCEGLTAYMADHLIKEQRGQGSDYRRGTLQRYTDYVNAGNDFPLTEFRSRYNAATEAVGYGKCLMTWNMLRQKIGDDLFVQGFQSFYRKNKFKRATFNDIRLAFENVTHENLQPFFEQWTTRKGAPELQLSNIKLDSTKDGFLLNFKLKQIQQEDAFNLQVPIAVYFKDDVTLEKVTMTKKEQSYQLKYPHRPIHITADPEFDIFRRLHYNEIPPSLSKVFGAEKVLILLPSKAAPESRKTYQQLADIWAKDQSGKITVRFDNEVAKLPQDSAVWLLGWDNLHRSVIEEGIADYDAAVTAESVRFDKTKLEMKNNSFIISVRHPQNPASAVVWLKTAVPAAVPGLARKLPHYGKYSYLAFTGDEPTNIAKGQWPAVHSPLSATIPDSKGNVQNVKLTSLPIRHALAKLGAVFSEDALRKHVEFLASSRLEGRGLGSPGLDEAADYIVAQFKKAGLQPAGDDGSFYQKWSANAGENGKKVLMKNIVAVLQGTKKELAGQSVVVCAHYDHLGHGWPDVHRGDEGKIHYGADDNASGVAVMLELAKVLTQNLKPDRSIVFVAFTGEEEGLLGSKYYVKNMTRYPADKIIGVLNLDTVGRLGNNKLMVLNSSSAREWKFIFMGGSYVTGVESQMISQDLDASDQGSFIAAGIPAVQFFSGPNEDYHRPSDTADKIDAAGMVKVATFVKEAVVYLAERKEPLTFQGKATPPVAATSSKTSGRKVSTGTVPDFAYTGKGVRIAAVSSGSPVAKAGLQKGDIIIQLGDRPVNDLREYSDALKMYHPGDEVKLVYLRQGEIMSVRIELAAR